MKFRLDSLHGLGRNQALIVGFPIACQVAAIGVLLQPLLDAAVAQPQHTIFAAAEKVEDFVTRDGEEPASKGSACRVIFQPGSDGRYRAENFLHHIGGVRILQATLACEPINDGSVEAHELVPRLGVAPSRRRTNKLARVTAAQAFQSPWHPSRAYNSKSLYARRRD